MIARLLRAHTPESVKNVARRLFGAPAKDYRGHLFDELVARLAGKRPLRILEIGPKDGLDTARLLTLAPEQMLLVDLEDKRAENDVWLPKLARPGLEIRYGNLMYEPWVDDLEPFDLVWCTGVLYHNPEQLRMVARLFDLTRPGGLLVLESATARRRFLANENCVEIWYPSPQGAVKRKYHISSNVTHLPSRKAIESWMAMSGFIDIRTSAALRLQSRALARDRAAFIAERGTVPGSYYGVGGHDFRIGKSR
ncbi:MAG: methyltransferase domain-containing protein [Alphaproteobacteria bacterium]|nr:methyltransferase domain-containing protein [Alphaproteobacteria bacterium]